MYEKFAEFIKDKQRICVIQAENPDGDSLGSAIALDYLLEGKDVTMYCPIDIPRYLHYFEDWARVSSDFDFRADGYIIVDTAAEVLISKLLDDSAIRNRLYNAPVMVLDHHETLDDLQFPHESIIEVRPACTELIYEIAVKCGLTISRPAADAIFMGIMSDTLGLTSSSTTARTFEVCADLMRRGSNIAALEENRREYMKKSVRIMEYKAELMQRVDFWLDNTLATVHIAWEDISEYSDEYNPNVLILEELRMVQGVKVAVAIKTYPDGKVTGKIRTMGKAAIAEKIGGYFGGGGHAYAAGFRTYDTSYDEVVRDLVRIVPELLADVEIKSAEDGGEVDAS
ncbi:DHH family phosphoesterase [Candidatus Saccharibacteria bacterium]|nr:DHH family phosphoesterase [Candidatus Saccharibacteria bacterium]